MGYPVCVCALAVYPLVPAHASPPSLAAWLPPQDKALDFYEQFHVIVLGLDSLEARRYMNSVACSFLGEPGDSFLTFFTFPS